MGGGVGRDGEKNGVERGGRGWAGGEKWGRGWGWGGGRERWGRERWGRESEEREKRRGRAEGGGEGDRAVWREREREMGAGGGRGVRKSGGLQCLAGWLTDLPVTRLTHVYMTREMSYLIAASDAVTAGAYSLISKSSALPCSDTLYTKRVCRFNARNDNKN